MPGHFLTNEIMEPDHQTTLLRSISPSLWPVDARSGCRGGGAEQRPLALLGGAHFAVDREGRHPPAGGEGPGWKGVAS